VRKAPQSKAKTGKIIEQAKTVGGKCGGVVLPFGHSVFFARPYHKNTQKIK